ncbi:MAG: site-2 protease family protein [Dehalococcoidales bacterium]|nr:MAG: site-2 protease family protein [Dehalococcoidales bacterium]
MNRTFYIGRLFGIEFRLHFTWFIIFFLVTLLLVEPNYDRWFYWLLGISSSLLFFASVLAHELAHSLVGKANGIPISNITLFIFGGVAVMRQEAEKPGTEFRMAIAGPLCSLFIGGIFGLMLLIPAVDGPVARMISWLAIMNGILAAFNLIPGFPLDGGRVLRSVLWRTTGSYLVASRIATWIGQGFGYLLIFAGILIIFIRPFDMTWFDGLWISFIGWFLSSSASASYRQVIRQETVRPSNDIELPSADYTVLPRKGEKKD